MSAKISTMSAGRAGSSKYNVNVNGNQGGGSKKGGLAPTTNKRVSYVLRAIQKRAYSSPDQRKMVYCVNQLGGIGAPTKMFATGADGSCSSCSKEAKAHNFVVLAYRQLLGRGVDQSGLRKYRKQILNDQRGLCVGMSQVVFDLTNSPEGRKYMNKLGSVETQKHRAIVNEYIKKACTVVPVLSSSGSEPICEIDPDSSNSLLKQKIQLMFEGCPDLVLTVDELKDYFLEKFAEWEASAIEEAATEDDLANIDIEKTNLDEDALELAKSVMFFFDTSGDDQIDSGELRELSDMRGSEDIQEEQDLIAACKNSDVTEFLDNITVSFQNDNGYKAVNYDDWNAYVSDEERRHPAFTPDPWNDDLVIMVMVDLDSGEIFARSQFGQAPENAQLMMRIDSLLDNIVPMWKMSGGYNPLSDLDTINNLDEDEDVTKVTFNINNDESFMIDTNRSELPSLDLINFYNGVDTYIRLFAKNGQQLEEDDDGADDYDSRITLDQNYISTLSEDNTAVFYALVMNRPFSQHSRQGVVTIKDYQDINCASSYRMCSWRGNRIRKFQVNLTTKKTDEEYPRNESHLHPNQRVTLADQKAWYNGTSISTQDGLTTYTGPESHFTDYGDFSSSCHHKWYKITLNNIE